MEEVILLVDDLKLLSATPRCRICHDEEFETSESLEAPCACSGTVKVNKLIHNFSCLHSFILLLGGFFNCHVLLCSLLTETAYKDGVTRKEILYVKYVFRY